MVTKVNNTLVTTLKKNKVWQNSKCKIVGEKISNCEEKKTQKLKLWHNSKYNIVKKKLVDPNYVITLKLKLSLNQFKTKSLLVTITWQTWQLMRCSQALGTLLQSHNVLDWKDKIQFFLMEDPFKTVFMINSQEEVEWLSYLLK